MPIKKLTPQNAIIQTAAVEIKTLTLNGRQVTLSTFRQLPNESPFDCPDVDLVELRGMIWGRVNYHPDQCDIPNWDHCHVVWQHGDVLKRGIVWSWRVVFSDTLPPDTHDMLPAGMRPKRPASHLLSDYCPVIDTVSNAWFTDLDEDARIFTPERARAALAVALSSEDYAKYIRLQSSYIELWENVRAAPQLYIAT